MNAFDAPMVAVDGQHALRRGLLRRTVMLPYDSTFTANTSTPPCTFTGLAANPISSPIPRVGKSESTNDMPPLGRSFNNYPTPLSFSAPVRRWRRWWPKRRASATPSRGAACKTPNAFCSVAFTRKRTLLNRTKTAVEMTGGGKGGKPQNGFPLFPLPLEIAPRFPHFYRLGDESLVSKITPPPPNRGKEPLLGPSYPGVPSNFIFIIGMCCGRSILRWRRGT